MRIEQQPIDRGDVVRVVALLTEIRDNTRPANVEPKSDSTFAQERRLLDRLKAAERCVLDVAEALTGVRHDDIRDFDEVREGLLATITRRPLATGGLVSGPVSTVLHGAARPRGPLPPCGAA